MLSASVKNKKLFSYLLPYFAVIFGLHLFENVWITIFIYHIGIFVFLLVSYDKKRLQILFNGWNTPLALLLFVICLGNGFLIYFLWPFIKLENIDISMKLSNLGLYNNGWILFIIYYALITPLLEEIFWRDYLGGSSKYLVWSDIFFAGYHVLVLIIFLKPLYVFVTFLFLIKIGYLWRYLRNKLNGLFIPVISHAVADISTILAVYFLGK